MTANQIPLELKHVPSFEMADFIVSRSNEEAVSLLDGWRNWPVHVAALIGPAACGKSHLVHAWAKEQGAFILKPTDDIATIPKGSFVVVEDANNGTISEDRLFHLYNWIKEIGGRLVLTSSIHPNLWSIELPDLKSRLATVAVGEIREPDDDLLLALLVKLFSDRQLQVDMAVVQYVLPRIERSFSAVHTFVEQLDQSALANQRKITKPLARNFL